MTEFQNKSFSVYPGGVGTKEYRDNWDRIFGKKERDEPQEEPVPDTIRDPFTLACALNEHTQCRNAEEYGCECDCHETDE